MVDQGKPAMPQELKKPDSRLPAYLTALAAFIAAMMPFTAFINGRYSIELEREKFLKQLQLNYIDRALDTTRDPTYRESFLRFIVDTTESSDPIYQWASKEIAKTKELERLRAEFSRLDILQKETVHKLAKERNLRSRERTEMTLREQELSAQLAQASQDRSKLELALHEAELRSGVEPANPLAGESDVDRALTSFHRDPAVEAFIADCTQRGGMIHYHFGAKRIQQMNCQFETGEAPLIFGAPTVGRD